MEIIYQHWFRKNVLTNIFQPWTPFFLLLTLFPAFREINFKQNKIAFTSPTWNIILV